MRKIFLAILLGISGLCQAKDGITEIEIRGAFGIEIGKSYNDYQTEENNSFQFDPKESSYREFKNYQFAITPKSKKAFWIIASYTAPFPGKAIDEFEILKKILENKYKTLARKVNFTPKNYDEMIEIKNKNRSIMVTRRGNNIIIVYRDKEIQEKGRQEKIQIEAQKTNSSNL